MQSSRLHFIGTWRNRYRKRFPILSTGFDNEIYDINAPGNYGNSVIIHVDMVSFTYKDIGNNYCCQLFSFRDFELITHLTLSCWILHLK